MGQVELEKIGPVGVIRLVNPPLNPLTNHMRARLRDVAHDVTGRSDIRAVVLTSHGDRSLSVGSDIKGFPTTPEAGRAVSEAEHEAYDAFAAIPQPTVAVLRGTTLGGGLELSLTADIRVAEESAVLGLPEVKVGVFASGGGTQRLPQLIGTTRATRLLLLGDSIDAATALDWGLVTFVVPDRAAESEALRIAERLAALPQLALRASKHCVHTGLLHGRSSGRQAEIDSIATIYGSADAHEGVAAFIQKREPRFTHQHDTEGPVR
ncbi:enoyl-CoA hydratase/isomerase family protein [Mycobacterium yunnanensis]|uniref:Enoyl-CoA hydratase/isomerase family protein n=1 Tax=Mycobacterium yunnanensis TaxID=368477 RepID=A0A9X2Z4R2_9MYCO|nr:enoyl-CoA hydratase-related protein [Mycobacterium yunnanensis]MCV7423490.1 enoyl-CoA hydratase/isomerase family protein [Mycobacterium yunnanensis]